MSGQITISLNGDTTVVTQGATVSLLIEQLQLAGKRVAVELNQDILPRSEHHARELRDGDRVEIVQAIGGG